MQFLYVKCLHIAWVFVARFDGKGKFEGLGLWNGHGKRFHAFLCKYVFPLEPWFSQLNRMKILKFCFYVMLMATMLTFCTSEKNDVSKIPSPNRSVYFYKTVWNPDSLEIDFLQKFSIKKIYMRFFDVAPTKDGILVPNATIKFLKPIPDNVQIIPTIFIVDNCLRHNLSNLPILLKERIVQMCETNDIIVNEVQIDCDWTKSTEDKFFWFLNELKNELTKENIILSSTIRLHQLASAQPPVEYGILMPYNAGQVTDYYCNNPILDFKDVKPYIKFIKNYQLPICVAYPNFKWQLQFRNKRLQNILYDENLKNEFYYKQLDSLTYVAIRTRTISNSVGKVNKMSQVLPGDTILVRRSEIEAILKTKSELEKENPSVKCQTVIYDLNSKNINNLTTNEYEEIFAD